jgi:hypothetical protein
MTPAQYTALGAYINGTPALAAFITEGNIGAVMLHLNEKAAPDYIVWRSSVSQDEIMQNGFDWTRVDNLSVGKARIWEWLFDNQGATINPSKPNVRAGIDQCWQGTTADLNVRAAVYVHCKRAATVAEKLFATGLGTTVSPSLLAFEGDVQPIDIERALAGGQ